LVFGRCIVSTDTANKQSGWRFWLLWVFATTVGLAVGLGMGLAVSDVVGGAVGFSMFGAVFGRGNTMACSAESDLPCRRMGVGKHGGPGRGLCRG
jgi:hypothetical protein